MTPILETPRHLEPLGIDGAAPDFTRMWTATKDRLQIEQAQADAKLDQNLEAIETSVQASIRGVFAHCQGMMQQFMTAFQASMEPAVTTAVATQVALRLQEAKLKEEHAMQKTAREEAYTKEIHDIVDRSIKVKAGLPRRKMESSLTPGPKESMSMRVNGQLPMVQNGGEIHATEDKPDTPVTDHISKPRYENYTRHAENQVLNATGHLEQQPQPTTTTAPNGTNAGQKNDVVKFNAQPAEPTPDAEQFTAQGGKNVVLRDSSQYVLKSHSRGRSLSNQDMERVNYPIVSTQEDTQSMKRKMAEQESSLSDLNSKRARVQNLQPLEWVAGLEEPRYARHTPQLSGQRTVTFDEVYRNGTPEFKHFIVEYKPGSGNYYILRCDDHQVHFSNNPIHGAAKHVHSPAHGMMPKTHELAIEICGHLVTGCTPELRQMNNDMVNTAFKEGYRPYNRNLLNKSQRMLLDSGASAVPVSPTTPTSREIYVNGLEVRGRKANFEPKGTPKTERTFRGIANAEPANFYLGYWTSSRQWFPIIVVPLREDGSLKEIGLEYPLARTKLLHNIPRCYNVDRNGLRVTGWAKAYQEDGQLVNKREFPVMYFDSKDRKGMSFGWLAAKNIKEIDFDDPNGKANYPGFEDARQWFAELKRRGTYQEYKELGTRPNSPIWDEGEDQPMANTPGATDDDSAVRDKNPYQQPGGTKVILSTKSADDATTSADDATKISEDDPMLLPTGPLPEDKTHANHDPGSGVESESSEEPGSGVDMSDRVEDEEIEDTTGDKHPSISKSGKASTPEKFVTLAPEKTRRAVNGNVISEPNKAPAKTIETRSPTSPGIQRQKKVLSHSKLPLEDIPVTLSASALVADMGVVRQKAQQIANAVKAQEIAALALSVSTGNMSRSQNQEPKKTHGTANEISGEHDNQRSSLQSSQSAQYTNGTDRTTDEIWMAMQNVLQRESVQARAGSADAVVTDSVALQKATETTAGQPAAFTMPKNEAPQHVQATSQTPVTRVSLEPRSSSFPSRPNIAKPGEAMRNQTNVAVVTSKQLQLTSPAAQEEDVAASRAQPSAPMALASKQASAISPPGLSPVLPSMGASRSGSSTPVPASESASRRGTPNVLQPTNVGRWQAIRTTSQSSPSPPVTATLAVVPGPTAAVDSGSCEQSADRRGQSVTSSLFSLMQSPAQFAQQTPSSTKTDSGIGPEHHFDLSEYHDSARHFKRNNSTSPFLRVTTTDDGKGPAQTASSDSIQVTIDPGLIKSIVTETVSKEHTSMSLTLEDGKEQYIVFETKQIPESGRLVGSKLQARTLAQWLKKLKPGVEYRNNSGAPGGGSSRHSSIAMPIPTE